MKILILGSKGMLGQMAVRYFLHKNYHVETFDEKFEIGKEKIFKAKIASFYDFVIINCIGKIPQKTVNKNELFYSNTVIPLSIRTAMQENQLLIHPSTDCVYNGNTNQPYLYTDTPNSIDDYGFSKYLGDKLLFTCGGNTQIIRVSIIGEDNSGTNKGLLAWFLSNPNGSTLRGFTNHYWNGIATLQWCKIVEKLIQKPDDSQTRIVQAGTNEIYSKYEMLQLFNKIYNKECFIEKFETLESINRTLQPQIVAPPLEPQLIEMKAFWETTK